MKKNNTRNRILALVLCMVMILSQSTFIFAGETVAAPEVLQEVSAEPTVTEAPAAPVAEEAPVATQEPTPEITEAPTAEPTAEAATPEPTAEVESGAVTDSAQGAAAEATVENTETTEPTELAGAVTDTAQGAANAAEHTEEAAEGTPEGEAIVVEDGNTDETETLEDADAQVEALSEETYTQVLHYEDEDVLISVEARTANAIPENASLKVVPIVQEDKETEAQYKEVEEELQKKAEDEEYEIAGFLAYDITFVDVDGNEVEPNGDVKVSMEYKKAVMPDEIDTEEIAVEDLDVTVMYLDENDLGEIEVVDMVADETIEAEVKITENVEAEKAEYVIDDSEVYALTWTNEVPYTQVLTYEDTQVHIRVEATAENAIPENASLKVVPVLSETEETSEQYAEVEKQLQEKAETEEYEIAGFLAYDITFIDVEGNKIEPNGDVRVFMEYKEAVIPENLNIEEVANLDVTVMHLEEDENGEVKEVVDMVAEESIEAEVITTENTEVNAAEFITDSFSVYTITWKSNYSSSYDKELEAIVVDENGDTITGLDDESISISSGTEVVFSDSCKDLSTNEKTYVFTKAVIAVNANSIESGTEIYSMSGSYRNGFKYKTSEDADEQTFYDNYYNVYLVYAEQGTGNVEGGSTAQGAELAHQKYIKDNGDGTYDLTLNVIGAAGTETDPAEIDVIFVVDTSGSMKRSMSSNSDVNRPNRRIDKLNDAVEDAIDAIEARTDVEAKYALVTFASSATTKNSWTTSGSTIKSKLPTSVTGGTNYEDALLEVESLLNNSTVANDGATKIVVFLTDGDCTQYNYGNGTAGNSNSYDATAMSKAQTVLARLTKMNAFYTVGVGPASSYSHLSELNTKVPSGVSTKSYNGTDISKLDEAFDEIVGSVTKISASNVTIVDTLTTEVDLIENTELVIKVTDAEGNDVTQAEVTAGGITANYDAATKQITLDFADQYEVKDGYTYSVTAKIIPNEAADQLYISNNYTYPHIGEENTDAPGNTTSSGKKGIFSNVEDSAKLTYTTNGMDKEADYNRPVVQIKSTPTVPPTTEQELTREKYIKYYADSDSYDLTLNVAGQVGSVNNKALVDVILVVDTSGSMDGANLTATKSAVSKLVTSLNSKSDTLDAKCKITTFAGGSAIETSDWVTPTAAYTIINNWTDSDMDGGTNYQKGLESAATVLATKRNGSQTVVIFLTDGKPTFYGNEIGLGDETSVNTVNAAYTAAEGISCNQFYAVGINLPGENGITVYKNDEDGFWGSNEESYKTSGLAILQNIRDKVSATTKGAYNSTASELTDIFGTIAGSITKFFCTNVTIKDNLSEFVEVNGENAKLEIKVTKTVTAENGTTSEVVVGTSSGGTISTGATLTLDATSTNAAATLIASYNSELKQVVLDFPDDYELEADYKYYVTVNIIASEKAYEDYAKNNGEYNKDDAGNVIVGDGGTDAEGNTTSVNKPGFRSNTTASVTYTYNGTTNKADYDHPVVQVFVKDHSVEKKWEGSSLTSITANLNAKVTIDGVEKTITNKEFSPLPSEGQILDDNNEWKYTWSYLPKYYHENGKVSEITYSVTEEETNTIKEDYTVSYDTTENNKTVITNTFNKEWQMLKVSSSSDQLVLSGAEFELVSTTDSNLKYKAVSNENGIFEWKDSNDTAITVKDILAGTYNLKETKAPAGYAVNANVWTVTVERAGAIPTITLGDESINAIVSEDGNMYTFSFENEAIYDLPSTGSAGIYWYMIGGVLLMFAATLILYKNRRKEVLARYKY